ncbi:hypothetical protein GGF43_003602 [Coemansia sp. RSA 2618]|nr:hypothetical protein GGF43_003602 [Coemansia sp. RSA 2618]
MLRSLKLMYYLHFFVFLASFTVAEITSITSPLASAVWVPGKQGTVSYRISGEPDDVSYEIDLMSGDPDNAQLVHVFDQMAKPETSGVNSVMVDVPSNIPDGTYGIRLGLPDGDDWKYSQMFTISRNPDAGSSANTQTSAPHNKAQQTHARTTSTSDASVAHRSGWLLSAYLALAVLSTH